MKLSYKNMSALDLHSALAAARAENSSRGRCQALAWVARYVREQKHVVKTAEAAAQAAAEDEDHYSAVFPLAWPIRALLERGEPKVARRMLSEALSKAQDVTPASSQSEALFLLFQGAMHPSERLWEEPFNALVRSSLPADHWRQSRNLRDAICIAASADYPFALQAAKSLPDEKLGVKVIELLRAGKKQPPRPFFW